MLKDCTLIEALYCNENDSVVDVAKKLREHVIRYIFVIDSKQKPIGVISTTDINNRVVAEGKDPNKLKAKEIMTKPVYYCEENMDEGDAYKGCLKNNVATCPVTKNDRIVGMVTIHELLRKMTHVN